MAKTIKVPAVSSATDESGSAARAMVEGGVASAGVEVGGVVVPVVGEALGGFLGSLFLNRDSGKQYVNREAGRAAIERLLM